MEFSTLNGYKVKDKKAIRYYDSVADMKADTTLKNGMYAKTKGYYSANDGGGSEYHITSTESLTEYYETLNNNLYANLVIKDKVNVKQFGAKGDNTTNDSEAITKSINSLGYVNFVEGTYLINIDIDTDIKVEISGNENTVLKPYDNTKPVIKISANPMENKKLIHDLKFNLIGSEVGILLDQTQFVDNFYPNTYNLYNLYFYDSDNFTGDNIYLKFAREVNIHDVFVKRQRIQDTTRTGNGIHLTSCMGVIVKNSSFGFLNNGILIDTDNRNNEGTTIIDTELFFCNNGINAQSSNGYTLLDLRLTKLMIDQIQNIGVLLDGFSSATLTDSWLGQNVANTKGLSIKSTNVESYSLKVTNNSFWTNSPLNNLDQLYIEDNSSHYVYGVTIDSNTFFNYQNYAIVVNNSNNKVRSLSINNNNFRTTSSVSSKPLNYNNIISDLVLNNNINNGSAQAINDLLYVGNNHTIYNKVTLTGSEANALIGATHQNTECKTMVIDISAYIQSGETSGRIVKNLGNLASSMGETTQIVTSDNVNGFCANTTLIIPPGYFYAINLTRANIGSCIIYYI